MVLGGHVRDLIDNCGCYDSTCSCCTNTYVTEGARQESAGKLFGDRGEGRIDNKYSSRLVTLQC